MLGWVSCVLVALVGAACGEPTGVPDEGVAPNFSTAETTALSCPSATTITGSSVIGASGGTLTVGPHALTMPAGAVARPTRITMTLPASSYLEVRLSANDLESFQFRKEVTVRLSYERCDDGGTSGSKTAWYVDSETGEFVEPMRTADEPSASAVTFWTSHFSNYIVAN